MRPVMAPREKVVGPPVSIPVRESARVEPIFIDWLLIDARLNVDALLAVNCRRLMIVMMMLDDFTMHDRRPDVGFPFWIGPEIRSQGRTAEAHDRGRQESEALH